MEGTLVLGSFRGFRHAKDAHHPTESLCLVLLTSWGLTPEDMLLYDVLGKKVFKRHWGLGGFGLFSVWQQN